MAERFLLTNARIVGHDAVIDGGTVVVEDGLIAEVSARAYPAAPDVRDLGGRLLLPGIVDLHNDALEKEITPRPRAAFERDFALLHLDRKLAAAGVTTEFHAVYFANRNDIGRKVEYAGEVASTIAALRGTPHAAIDNQVLHRLDVRTPHALEALFAALPRATVPFVSINDHVPGQGQFNDLVAYRAYARSFISGTPTEEEVDAVIAERMARAAETEAFARAMLERIAAVGRQHGMILCSHDDDTPERVDLMGEIGCTIAEFPLTHAAAARARERGMLIAMGAPNVMQGRSLSNNASALDLLAYGLVDILVADYHASSLLADRRARPRRPADGDPPRQRDPGGGGRHARPWGHRAGPARRPDRGRGARRAADRRRHAAARCAQLRGGTIRRHAERGESQPAPIAG